VSVPQDARALYQTCRSEGAGQAEAFQTLGRYLYQVAYNLVRGRPQLHDLAEECTQEALVTIWQSLLTLEDPDRFLAWSARIVINKVYDACRRLGIALGSETTGKESEARLPRRRRIPLGMQESLDVAASGELPPQYADEMPTTAPTEHVSRRELLGLLTAGIARHPELSRQSKLVLMRGFLNDWDDNALAVLLGTSRSNVHTIRSRDLARLRADATFLRLLREYMTE